MINILFFIISFVSSLIWFCVVGSIITFIILVLAAFTRGEFKK